MAESEENISNFKETSGQVLINGALNKLPSAEFLNTWYINKLPRT